MVCSSQRIHYSTGHIVCFNTNARQVETQAMPSVLAATGNHVSSEILLTCALSKQARQLQMVTNLIHFGGSFLNC